MCNDVAAGPFAAQNRAPGAIEPDEVEAVLANIDANRRHLIGRFASHGSCSFCQLHPKTEGCVSEHGQSIPLTDIAIGRQRQQRY
jgi:hypothetical protein